MSYITGMVTRTRKGARRRLFIKEWMDARGLSDQKLGDRLAVARETVFRWRTEQHRLNPEKIAVLAQALDIEPEDLWRPPPAADAPPSVDRLLRDVPDEVRRKAVEMIEILKRTA